MDNRDGQFIAARLAEGFDGELQQIAPFCAAGVVERGDEIVFRRGADSSLNDRAVGEEIGETDDAEELIQRVQSKLKS